MTFVNTAITGWRALAFFCAVGAAIAEQVCIYRDSTCSTGAMCATLAPTAGFCQTAFGTYGILENVQANDNGKPVYLLQVYLDVACQSRSLAITAEANECTKVTLDQPGAIPPLFIKVTPNTVSRREEPAMLPEDDGRIAPSSDQEVSSDFADNDLQEALQPGLAGEMVLNEIAIEDDFSNRSARAVEDGQTETENALDEPSSTVDDTLENEVDGAEANEGAQNATENLEMVDQEETAVTGTDNTEEFYFERELRQIATDDDFADVDTLDIDGANGMGDFGTPFGDQALEDELDETMYNDELENGNDVEYGNVDDIDDLDADFDLL